MDGSGDLERDGPDTMFCAWDGSLGNGTVPQSILAKFAGLAEVLYFGQLTTTTFTAGVYSISENASTYTPSNASFH